MPSGFLNISGINELKENILKIQTNYLSSVKRAVDLVCTEIQSEAKTNFSGHPDGPNVITGRLKNSIEKVVKEDGQDHILGAVGTNVEYASYVEFGHSQEVGRYVSQIGKKLTQPNVKPYPFMRPAFSSVVDTGKAKNIFTDELRKV